MPDPESVAAVSTAVSETMKGMGGLFGPARDEIGQMFADYARVFRLKNQLKLFQKTKKYLGDSGIPIGQVNLKVLFPLIESASLEEDETIQDMWAKLLAQAAFGNQPQSFLSNCVDVLKSLSGREASVLELMYDAYPDWKKAHGMDGDNICSLDETGPSFPITSLLGIISTTEPNSLRDAQMHLDNLLRLGVVRYTPATVKFPDQPIRDGKSQTLMRYFSAQLPERNQRLTPDSIHMTTFGIRLLETCGGRVLNKKV